MAVQVKTSPPAMAAESDPALDSIHSLNSRHSVSSSVPEIVDGIIASDTLMNGGYHNKVRDYSLAPPPPIAMMNDHSAFVQKQAHF